MRSPFNNFAGLWNGRRKAKIYIGGVDSTKFSTAQGFSDFFRENYDPTNPVIVSVNDILSYQTEPDGNGRLNIELEILGEKTIPSNVFSNYLSNESGSRITYFIDELQIFTSLSGSRNFASNPLQFVLLRDLTDLSSQWNGFPVGSIIPRVLDFEGLQNLDDFYFDNYRDGNDRINIRNATNFLSDPATDDVFNNYNLNGNANAKKVIYVHPSMETINNGAPFNSLQQAITRGADVRYVSDTTTIPQEPTNITIQELGATYVILDFANIAAADFYDVFKDNFVNPVEQFFPIQEITNSNKAVLNLTPNTFYRFRLKTFDVNFNQSPKSNSVSFTTAATDSVTISQIDVGGTYVQFDITNTTPYTINEVEVYVDSVLNRNIQGNLSNAYVVNLNELTSYDIDIIAKTDENIDLISNTINATTTTIDTVALFQNAVAYYKLDETSGDAIDVVNGFNGTLFGGVTQGVTGLINTAYEFDGIDGRLNIPLSIYDELNSSDFTFSFWIKPNLLNTVQVLISDLSGGVFANIKLQLILSASNTIQYVVGDNSGVQVLTSTTTLNTSNFYYIQAKYNSLGDAQLKINNVVEDSHTFVNAPTVENLITIGIRPDNLFPFSGVIDEVNFINGQTTAAQDSELYNNGNGITI